MTWGIGLIISAFLMLTSGVMFMFLPEKYTYRSLALYIVFDISTVVLYGMWRNWPT